MNARPLRQPDLEQCVACWNETYAYDCTDEEKLSRIVLDDPNYDPAGTLVVEIDGRIVAFVSCVVRKALVEADGTTKPADEQHAYLKGICWRDPAAGEALLRRACEFAASRGKTAIKVVEYGGGSYFYPGIDLRYEPVLGLLTSNGFEQSRELQDVSLDLGTNPPGQGQYQKRRRGKMQATGVRLASYSPTMLDSARTFAPQLGIPTWFEPGWEALWADGRTIVALDGGEIVGFSRYHPHSHGPGVGGLGPIGSLASHRGKGIGSSLLDECMIKLQTAGCMKAIAGWANTLFYLRNGWRIERRYAVLRKEL